MVHAIHRLMIYMVGIGIAVDIDRRVRILLRSAMDFVKNRSNVGVVDALLQAGADKESRNRVG